MYAIVEIAGKQFRAQKDAQIKVPHLQAEAGSKVVFDHVLFYEDDKGKTQIGKPHVKGLKISATILEHGRDKKVIVFKKKRRKGYQVKNGHRQGFSIITIENIGTVKQAKKSAPKAEAQNEDVKMVKVKKAEPKKTKSTPTESKAKSSAVPKTKKAATAKMKIDKPENPAEKKEA